MAATITDPITKDRPWPRIAFCTDTFHEANGVARISREFAAFAKKHRLNMLVVHPGQECRCYTEGSVTMVEVAKSAVCLPLDMGLRFDLLIARRYRWLKDQLCAFAPDVVHITGPGDIGMLCARLSKTIRAPKVPLVAAWHTNLHQYARIRARSVLGWLPARWSGGIEKKIESRSLWAAARFYRTAQMILAPNAEILAQLTRLTGKPGCIMPHGVSTSLFIPANRDNSDIVTLGYAGRLTAEKNVRFLAELEQRLPADVRARVRFLIVGDGHDRAWLEHRLPSARFTGVLTDQPLASAFAEMDLLLFPSRSDTLGLVVLEAMSSGVPVVAFKLAGPKSSIIDGETGYTARDESEFIARVVELVRDPRLRRRFGASARQSALEFSWDAVFASFYDAYRMLVPAPDSIAAESAAKAGR